MDFKLIEAILFVFLYFIWGVGLHAWDHGDDATVSTSTPENLPLFLSLFAGSLPRNVSIFVLFSSLSTFSVVVLLTSASYYDILFPNL